MSDRPAAPDHGITSAVVSCWQGWGPGYSSGSATAVAITDGQGKDSAAERQPGRVSTAAADVSGASPTNTPGASPPAGTDSATPPASPVAPTTSFQTDTAHEKTAGASARRSWIWAFLGTGFVGWIYKWEFILIGLPLIYTLLRNSANWTTRSNKNIVICLDGTSNTPDQIEMGFAAQTNWAELIEKRKGRLKLPEFALDNTTLDQVARSETKVQSEAAAA